MEKLSIQDLSSVYNPKSKKKMRIVLRHVSFEVKGGEFFVVLGESGCGKTTLLKCIAGFQKYIGKIYKDGEDFDVTKTKDRDLSYVTQYQRLYPSMTIFDNIAYPLKIAKVPYEEINDKVFDAAKTCGIELILSRKPRHISVGQEQRVSIAKTIVKKSDICLFDEPFSAQDALNKKEMGDLLKEINKKLGIAFIYVTHDQTEALRLADTLMLLNPNGQVEQIGKPEEFIKRPKSQYVKDFFSQDILSRDMIKKDKDGKDSNI